MSESGHKPPFPALEHSIAAAVALTFAHAAAVQLSSVAAAQTMPGGDAKAFFLASAWQAAAHSIPLAVTLAIAAKTVGRAPVALRVAVSAALVVAARLAYALWQASLDPQTGTPFFMSGGAPPALDVVVVGVKANLASAWGWLVAATVGVALASSRAGHQLEGVCLSAPIALVWLASWLLALPDYLKMKDRLIYRTPVMAVVLVVALSVALPLVERVLIAILERLNVRERH